MTALSQLTPVQADAVTAAALLLLLDPEEFAVELFPLLHINPHRESREAEALAPLEAPTQEISIVRSTVNTPLTPTDLPRSTP